MTPPPSARGHELATAMQRHTSERLNNQRKRKLTMKEGASADEGKFFKVSLLKF